MLSGITLRDLAEKLGVSTATISMVLNNKPGISEATRKRVMAEVQSSGYSIDRFTTPSKKENINFIIYKKHGKVIADTPFFSTLIESIEQKAGKEGYRLSIRYLNGNSEVFEVNRRQQEGILLLGTEMSEEDLVPFMKLGVPLVVLDNSFSLTPVNTVAIDNFGGIATATQHLIDRGHTNIGYMRSSIEITNFAERFFGFSKCLKDNKLTMSECIYLGPNMDDTYRAMKQWLENNELKSTAFVSDNDFIALGAIRALREQGITLGKDVSVVGFDDLPFTSINEPPLSSVRVFNDVLGSTVFARMVEVIRNPGKPFSHIRVGTELKERESVSTI